MSNYLSEDWIGDGECDVCGRTANTIALACAAALCAGDPGHSHTLCPKCDLTLSPGDEILPLCPTKMTDAERVLLVMRNSA